MEVVRLGTSRVPETQYLLRKDSTVELVNGIFQDQETSHTGGG